MSPLLFFVTSIGAGTIFRLGEQKLNEFSVGEAKIGEKQSRQSNSKYNVMHYVFIEKGMQCTMESGASWGIFENFCVKSNLTLCKVTFNCKLQKNGGAGCTSCSPNNFVGGATSTPAPPVPAPMVTSLPDVIRFG